MIKVIEKRKHTERKGPTAVSPSPELHSSQDKPWTPLLPRTAHLQTATSSPCSPTTFLLTPLAPQLSSLGLWSFKLCHFPTIPNTPDPILTLWPSVPPHPAPPHRPLPSSFHCGWSLTVGHFLVQCFWRSYYIFLIINCQPPQQNYCSLLPLRPSLPSFYSVDNPDSLLRRDKQSKGTPSPCHDISQPPCTRVHPST